MRCEYDIQSDYYNGLVHVGLIKFRKSITALPAAPKTYGNVSLVAQNET